MKAAHRKRFEVWVEGRRVGKRESNGWKDFTHATYLAGERPQISYHSSERLAYDRAGASGAKVVPVKLVEKFTKVDEEGRPI